MRTYEWAAQCDIIYSPSPSGNYLITGECLTPRGKYLMVSENRSLYNILKKTIKVGSEVGNTTLKISGQVIFVRYVLEGKYRVTLLSRLGVTIASIIALLVIVGATYTLINWRKYAIH